MQTLCPICKGTSFPLDVVDFNKSCEEIHGKYLPLAGIPIYYFLCEQCGFCFAPEFSEWKKEDFEQKIYNNDYVLVDPEYVEIRPNGCARNLMGMMGDKALGIRHLDYGGGSGLLSEILRKAGWHSTSYDPFVDRDVNPSDLGKYDLITAYEVFEHVPDVTLLISTLSLLLVQDGIILFTTVLSDGNISVHKRIDWWYASPRNGHISLFSSKSLAIFGAMEGFRFNSSSTSFHVLWRTIPLWAKHIFQVS